MSFNKFYIGNTEVTEPEFEAQVAARELDSFNNRLSAFLAAGEIFPHDKPGEWGLNKKDAQAVWAIFSATADQLANGGQQSGNTLPNGEAVPDGMIGGINSKKRKIEVLGWMNLRNKINQSLTEAELIEWILQVRPILRFIGKPQ